MILALVLLTASFSGHGCRRQRPSSQSQVTLVAQTDALGRQLSLAEYPRRVVSMAPSNTEMLLSLGLRDKLVGVTSFYGRPQRVEGIADIGGYTNPSVEKIVSLQPDLVFAARGNPRDVIQQLRRHGVKVFTLDTRSLPGLLADIRKVAALTGASERATRLLQEIESEIRRIRRKVAKLPHREKPRVFWIGQEQPLRTAGPGSLVDELINLAGGKNIARDEKSRWPAYSMEKVILRDPQVIILSDDKYKSSPRKVAATIARFKKNAVWKNLSAVREGRVHFIPTDILGQPSPACVEGLKLLANRLHPDLFPEQPARTSRNRAEN